MKKGAKMKRQDAVTSSLLLLVGIDAPVRLVATWTDDHVRDAEKWAGAVHLKASDNIVRVPPRPCFLPEPWSGPGGTETKLAAPAVQLGQPSLTKLNPAAQWPFPGGKS